MKTFERQVARMKGARTRGRLYAIAIISPFYRIREMRFVEWLAMAGGGLVELVSQSIFIKLLLILCLSGLMDYYFGRAVAKAEGKYSPAVAHAGFIGKVAGVALVVLVRALTWSFHPFYDTKGAVATALCVGLVVVDLESIHYHRVKLGSKPVPGFSHAVDFLKTIADRILLPRKRDDDDA